MIYLITGLMASGKSTVAEILARRLDRSVHLHGDIFRRMIVSGRADMAENPSYEALSQLDLRYRLTANAAKEYHHAGFDVVVQDNYYGEQLPHMIDLLAPEPVFTVVLCPSIESIKLREAGRNKSGYGGFSVESLYEAFHSETPRIGLWLDNSHQTPEETAAQIWKGANP